MPTKGTRNFVVTNFNLDCDYEALVAKGQVRFVAYGVETAPTTGRLHHQCYVHFHNPRATGKLSCSRIGRMFDDRPGSGGSFTAPMKGSFKQNEAYCSKEATLIKVGDEPRQGYRGDLKETVDLITSGELKVDDVIVGDPMMFHMYGRTMQAAETRGYRERSKTFRILDITVLWGAAGVGKTRSVYDKHGVDNIYVLNAPTNNSLWFDGYEGQDVLLIDDFEGWIKYSFLLKILDGYQLRLPVKTRFTYALWTKVYITSNCDPETWYYRGLTPALERRINVIKHIAS